MSHKSMDQQNMSLYPALTKIAEQFNKIRIYEKFYFSL